MKRNFSLCLHSHRHYGYIIMKRQLRNLVRHHFGNHKKCSKNWCPYHLNSNNKEKQMKLKYRNKKKHKKFYYQMKHINVLFTADDKLKEIYHMWSTNRNESVNRSITKMARKDTYLCSTICSKARIHTSVGIRNAGVKGFYSSLFSMLGINYNNTIIQKQHEIMDRKRKYDTKYIRRPQVKKRRAKSLSNKIHKMVNNEKTDKKKGLQYKSNMNGPALKKIKNNERKINDGDSSNDGKKKATTRKKNVNKKIDKPKQKESLTKSNREMTSSVEERTSCTENKTNEKNMMSSGVRDEENYLGE